MALYANPKALVDDKISDLESAWDAAADDNAGGDDLKVDKTELAIMFNLLKDTYTVDYGDWWTWGAADIDVIYDALAGIFDFDDEDAASGFARNDVERLAELHWLVGYDRMRTAAASPAGPTICTSDA